jgi:hypothetical protein
MLEVAGAQQVIIAQFFIPDSRFRAGGWSPFQYRNLKAKPFGATREYMNLCKRLAKGPYA